MILALVEVTPDEGPRHWVLASSRLWGQGQLLGLGHATGAGCWPASGGTWPSSGRHGSCAVACRWRAPRFLSAGWHETVSRVPPWGFPWWRRGAPWGSRSPLEAVGSPPSVHCDLQQNTLINLICPGLRDVWQEHYWRKFTKAWKNDTTVYYKTHLQGTTPDRQMNLKD